MQFLNRAAQQSGQGQSGWHNAKDTQRYINLNGTCRLLQLYKDNEAQ